MLLFGLVGLQLRPVLDGLSGENGWSLVGDAALIALAVIVLRIVWVFPATYLPRWLFPRIARARPVAALALPRLRRVERHARRRDDRGGAARPAATPTPATPLPGRDLIVFFAFAVVLATLVGQGLTLPLR